MCSEQVSTCEEQPSGQDNEDNLKHDRVWGNQPSVEKDDKVQIRQASGQTEQPFTGQEGEQLSEQDKDLQEIEQIEVIYLTKQMIFHLASLHYHCKTITKKFVMVGLTPLALLNNCFTL